jgi:PAS domain S-box-containing protein
MLVSGEFSAADMKYDVGKTKMPQNVLSSLTDSASFASVITAHAIEAIFLLDDEGRTLFANPAAEKMFGWSKDELMGKKLHDILHHHHPDGRPFPMSECPLGEVFATGRSLERHSDIFFDRQGRQVPVSCSNAAIVEDGRVAGGVLIVRDVSEQRALDEERELLRKELAHRIKNLIAIVQAVATQSLKGEDLAAAREVFLGRLTAISHAQTLVEHGQNEQMSVTAVAQKAMSPFRASVDAIRIDGPETPLSAKQALALSMALHELATNATKYGALSVPTGRVTILWSVSNAAPYDFSLTWSEEGGPPVEPPSRKGFGSRMVERMLAADFGGKVEILYQQTGVTCHLQGTITGSDA